MATETSSTVELENVECSTCSSVSYELSWRCTHTDSLPGLELSLENSVLRDSAESESAFSQTETITYSTASSSATDTTIEVKNQPTVCVVCKSNKSEETVNFGKKLFNSSDAVTENWLKPKKVKLSEWNEKSDELNTTFVCNCENSSGKSADVFCLNCSVAACVVCCHNLHVSHELCDIRAIACEFQHHMGTAVDSLAVGAHRCQSMMQSLCDKKNNLSNQLAKVDDDICSAADQLKNIIEQHKLQALESLAVTRQIRLRQINSLQNDLKQKLSLIENLNKCTKEITTVGKIGNLVTTTTTIHDQADDLLKLDVLQALVDRINSINVSFTASTEMFKDGDNMVGKINDTFNVEGLLIVMILHII